MTAHKLAEKLLMMPDVPVAMFDRKYMEYYYCEYPLLVEETTILDRDTMERLSYVSIRCSQWWL